MKYLKTYEAFNTPREEHCSTPENHDDKIETKIKEKEDRDKKERETIEDQSNGLFSGTVPPVIDDITPESTFGALPNT